MGRIEKLSDSITLYLGDCREILPTLGKIDAVVTDPPYGIGADKAAADAALQRIKADGKSKAGRGWKFYGETDWDNGRPPLSLILSLCEMSEYQIIWGGNYFTDVLPPTMQWLIWDKGQRDFSLADFEMAWSSQKAASRIFDYPRAAALQDGKEHPTQKPIEVMKWCLEFLPEKCRTIVDPFMGSGTTGVACAKVGRNFIGIEREPKYFDIACHRIADALARPDLFIEPPKPAKQEAML
jgi:DNA modification methylase